MARGLDHIVVAVRDLDAAAAAYSALGFTVTPENRHPWGTANRLVQLDGFFIELLSIADASRIPEPIGKTFSFGAFNRDFLSKREGASMLVLESRDAAADRESFLKAGLDVFEPFSFERVANLPDGSTVQVAFDLTHVRDPLAPDIGFFTCHNRFPENFWKEAFQTHSNGAQRIDSVHLCASDPSDHHEFLGAFTGLREMRATSLGLTLETPRGTISVLTPMACQALFDVAVSNVTVGPFPQIAAIEVGCAGLDQRKIVPGDSLFGVTVILNPLK
ncbi:VOC family protein [Rhodobacterales bacterium]|nr:VOC family protein [Rhodobacterales bacterium]